MPVEEPSSQTEKRAELEALKQENTRHQQHIEELRKQLSKTLEQQESEIYARPVHDPNCPEILLCPISHVLMRDPVTASDGVTYDRSNIERWLRENSISFASKQPLSSKGLFPNTVLLEQISKYKETFFHQTENLLLGRENSVQDVEEAISRIFISSEQGHPIAQFYRGFICDEDCGKSETLKKKLELLSAHGEIRARGCLILYGEDLSVHAHNATAFHWYQQSANQDCLMGSLFLAFCYEKGKGGPKRASDADHWLKKAAEKSSLINTLKIKLVEHPQIPPSRDRWDACKKGDLKFLQERGNIVEKLIPGKFYFQVQDQEGKTPLHYACERGDTECVRYILSFDIDINCRDHDQNQPMHIAAAAGHLDVIKLLVQRGADVNSIGVENRTPLHRASYNNNPGVVEYLLEQKANPDAITSESDGCKTPLIEAVYRGNISVVKRVVKYADVNVEDRSGCTPLRLALLSGNINAAILITQRTNWKPTKDPNNLNHLSQLKKITPPRNRPQLEELLNRLSNVQSV